MLKKIAILFFGLHMLCGILRADDFGEMFKERAKCVVTVTYIVEEEEYRQRYVTTGLIADESGLIVLPASEIPEYTRLSSLKDFRVFIFEGDEDGYPAEYLGSESMSMAHFLKLKNGLTELMTPYTKFEKGKPELGEELWGVGISQFLSNYEPYLIKSYVSDIGRRPRWMAGFGGAVTTLGGPVFNNKGQFVAWGQSEYMQGYQFDTGRGGRNQLTLISPTQTAIALFPEELEDILKNIPKDPSGDPRGWLGVVDVNILKRDVAKLMGLENKPAFVVSDVIKKTGAEAAGIKKGDIIVGVDGKDIERLRSERDSLLNFLWQIAKKKPGDKVTLNIMRGSEAPKDYEVTMGEQPKTFRKSEFKYFKRLGFSVREYLMDDAVARRKLDNDLNGAVVQFVRDNSPASSALPTPLAAGDLIKEINSEPVKTYAEAVEKLSKINDDESAKELVILSEDARETKVIRIKLD